MLEIKKENPGPFLLNVMYRYLRRFQMAIQKVVSTFGSLDVALNNAGIGGESSKVGDMSEQAWLKVIGIKLKWCFQWNEA